MGGKRFADNWNFAPGDTKSLTLNGTVGDACAE